MRNAACFLNFPAIPVLPSFRSTAWSSARPMRHSCTPCWRCPRFSRVSPCRPTLHWRINSTFTMGRCSAGPRPSARRTASPATRRRISPTAASFPTARSKPAPRGRKAGASMTADWSRPACPASTSPCRSRRIRTSSVSPLILSLRNLLLPPDWTIPTAATKSPGSWALISGAIPA